MMVTHVLSPSYASARAAQIKLTAIQNLARPAITAFWLKVSQQLVRLSVLRNAADDNLAGASVGELQPVGPIGLDELRLLFG
jgi:hypothetical protein